MKFIHTADWQIGKPFRQFGDREAVLRRARLTVIETIGQLARDEGAAHVLVAGDIYDSEAPARQTLLEPLERMRLFPDIHWHLIPGNHDPHRPQGVWDRVRAANLPGNVHLHLTAAPAPLGDGAMLLPAPLTRKSEGGDLTEWMNHAETPPGLVRIGLAHGAVAGFGSGGEAVNPIDPARTRLAGLSYLALGDWHRTMQVTPTVWYAGTPEPDRAGSQEFGQVLVVDIAGAEGPVRVTPRNVGTFRWLTLGEHVTDAPAIADLETRLRALPDLSSIILRLAVEGHLPLGLRADLERRLHGLSAVMFDLVPDFTRLILRPTAEDLDAIELGGVLRDTADRLKAMVDAENSTAEQRMIAGNALVELFALTQDGAHSEVSLAEAV